MVALEKIKANSHSLTLGRYGGVAEREEKEYDFKERLMAMNSGLSELNEKARRLERQIEGNVRKILNI